MTSGATRQRFDVFFSFSKMDTGAGMPSDRDLYRDLFRFIEQADALGYERAWVGEAHYSLVPEQTRPDPLLPHFNGELCINTDVLQIASAVLPRTRRIGIGSAIRNILVNGGPVAHAEMIRTFLTIHGETLRAQGRKLHIGFGSGRFAYANAANGVRPRHEVERILWPQLRGAVLREATEIFLRLLSGETIGSADIPKKRVRASEVDPETWAQACAAANAPTSTTAFEFDPFWQFEPLRVLPTDCDLSQLELTVGSHDPELQTYLNRFLPVKVFNLSVTPDDVIEATHERMAAAYHPAGGSWQRHMMPRTVMVFVRADDGVDSDTLDALAAEEAKAAMHAYWRAMEGTVDEDKVRKGMENAVHGSPMRVAQMIQERFHPEDRLMVWFDFNTSDPSVVTRRMEEFQKYVVPLLGRAASHLVPSPAPVFSQP